MSGNDCSKAPKDFLGALNNFIKKGKVLVILGPTASGKTSISIKLAKRLNGEIISADSRTIYKYMDVGTAKPTKEEQENVPHFGFDLVEPGERFTVADWKEYAEQKIYDIRNRGHLPIIVGGTGLYIDALVYNYQFNNDVKKTCSDREEICTNFLIIGVKNDTNTLQQRIADRLNKLFIQPLFDETKFLSVNYGWNSQAMKANIYKFAAKYLSGELKLEEAKKLAYYEDWHLAKRQLTWFKRNRHIIWRELAEIEPYVIKYIEDEQNK